LKNIYEVEFTVKEVTEGTMVVAGTDKDEVALKLREFFENNGFVDIDISSIRYLGEESSYLHNQEGMLN